MSDIKKLLRACNAELTKKAADYIATLEANLLDLTNMLVLCGEPEIDHTKSHPERLRGLIDGLITQRNRAEAAEAKIAEQARDNDILRIEALRRTQEITTMRDKIAEQAREIERLKDEVLGPCRAARIERDNALSRIEAMDKALEPFAKEAEKWQPVWTDAQSIEARTDLIVGDLRRARAARENEE